MILYLLNFIFFFNVIVSECVNFDFNKFNGEWRDSTGAAYLKLEISNSDIDLFLKYSYRNKNNWLAQVRSTKPLNEWQNSSYCINKGSGSGCVNDDILQFLNVKLLIYLKFKLLSFFRYILLKNQTMFWNCNI